MVILKFKFFVCSIKIEKIYQPTIIDATQVSQGTRYWILSLK